MNEPEMTRPQAVWTARQMYESGWRILQIRDYLASRGQTAHRSTIKRWVDPEYAELYNRTHAADERRRWRDKHGTRAFIVLDDDARARLADELATPVKLVMTEELMLALRVEDGLSYTAIGKVAGRIFGTPMSGERVRYRLAKHGVPKNPAKVRNAARNLNTKRVAA